MNEINGIRKQFPLRKWSEFIEHFDIPNSTTAIERLEINLQYYLTNYLVLGLLFFIYCMITYPSFLFACIVICPTWLYFLLNSDETLALRRLGFNINLTTKKLYTTLTIITVILFILTSGLMMVVLFSLLGIHAICRKKSIKSKFNMFVEKTKGEDIGTEFHFIVNSTDKDSESRH